MMSVIGDSMNGSSVHHNNAHNKEDELFTTTKGKMRVQQRMIDLTARELQSTRCSSRTIANESSSPSCALKENIVLLENKLMKLFSRQLMHKHICLREFNHDTANNLNIDLDDFISFEMFLTVAGLEELTVKAFLAEKDTLSVDKLFLMTPQELQDLFLRLDICTGDCHKLVSLLDLMTHYYEKWVKGENPTAGLYDIRRNSSTGRLNSLTSLDSIRKDSSSTISPPAGGGNQGSRSSTPLTPLTPSNHSPFLGLPHQNSVPIIQTYSHEVSSQFARSNSSTGSVHNATLSDISACQHLSSSLSSIGSDLSSSHQQTNTNYNYNDGGPISLPPPPPPPLPPLPLFNEPHPSNYSSNERVHIITTPTRDNPQLHSSHSTSSIRAKRKLGHTRSHSNPPLANLIMPEMVPENSVPDYRSPSPPYYNGHAPPTRTGSHPSIIHNSTLNNSVVSNSSSSTKSHPQVRRLMAGNYAAFSRSISTDLGDVQPEPPIRSNSEASGVQSASPRQRRLSKDTGTSTSMVDLPLIQCSGDQYDLDPAPTGKKSHSVPRLASLVVNNNNNSGEHNNNNHNSISVPTSPRLPSNYNPTGVIGHKIDHRFVTNLFLVVQECDYCKKTLVMNGYKCRYCKYKCHKHCSKLAPSNCGLPKYFLNYARQHLMMSPSYENVHQVNNTTAVPPPPSSPAASSKGFLTSSGEYVSPSTPTPNNSSDGMRGDGDTFLIQDLSREPSNSQYSPVVSTKRYHPPSSPANGRGLSTSSTSRLEVPQLLHPSPLHTRHHRPHSTSSSPSTSSQSSPCLTPVSPRSPLDSLHMEYPGYLHRSIPIVLTDNSDTTDEEEGEEGFEDHSDGFTSDSSGSSFGDYTRQGGVVNNRLRLPAQGIAAQSLPNLLLAEKRQVVVVGERGGGGGSEHAMYTTSEDNLQSWFVPRKVSLAGTISTADSKTSTLVGSIMEDIDDDDDSYDESEGFGSQGTVDEGEIGKTRIHVRHRNSVVDEWIIPYGDIKLGEKLGGGPVAEVYKGYWHGDVAVKRFVLPNGTPEQLRKFREEVAILKKTRHENLALFMGACLTTPNLAIVTSFCKGYTLYKLLHYWSEVFLLERLVSVGRQIAQAMGYLHARGIIHKGLNSKNIFLEKTKDHKEKVVITDMGLSSLSSLLSYNANSLVHFPRSQLYYLAPEIIRLIRPSIHFQLDHELFMYSHATDIYSFGTILYELITRRYPFSTDNFGFPYESEVVIFLVGRGERQPFKTTDVPKQLKDIVWQCWSKEPTVRPPFSELQERLARLCRKHTPITRSPSHPINLSKSVDNLLYI